MVFLSGKAEKARLGQGDCGDPGKRPEKRVSRNTGIFRPKSMEYAAVVMYNERKKEATDEYISDTSGDKYPGG